MTTPKPRLFVGSSSEAKRQASAFASRLGSVAHVVPWWDDPSFAPMAGTLDALIASAQLYDFGVFLMTPDDEIESRGERGRTARDNVLFEMGLFLGELGRDRTTAFIQSGGSVKTPTDLLGITIPRFHAPESSSFGESIRIACVPLLSRVPQLNFRELNFELVDGWGLSEDNREFRMVLAERLISDSFHRLQDHSLAMVVRRRNDSVDRAADETVVIAPMRPVPKSPQRIVMTAPIAPLLSALGEPVIDGLLFLVPPGHTSVTWRSINDVLAAGGRLVEARGRGIEHLTGDD